MPVRIAVTARQQPHRRAGCATGGCTSRQVGDSVGSQWVANDLLPLLRLENVEERLILEEET